MKRKGNWLGLVILLLIIGAVIGLIASNSENFDNCPYPCPPDKEPKCSQHCKNCVILCSSPNAKPSCMEDCRVTDGGYW